MNPTRSSWKMPLVCGVAIIAVLRFGAPTMIPAAPPAVPAASASPAVPAPDYAAAAAELKTADALFDYISQHATVDDIEPDASLPSEQQIAQVHKMVDQKVALLHPAIDLFLKQNPQDPRRWDVQLQRVFFLKAAENISNDDYVNTLRSVAAAPDASGNARHRARAFLLQGELEEVDPAAGLTPALEADMAAYEKDFPDDESGKDLVEMRLRLLKTAAPDKVNAALEALVKSPNKATAEAARTQLAMATEPLDLKFDSAIDGRPVDLAKLRGKVVLLDFWATWCGPCMAKLPEILKLNAKYKNQDFQLLGVSLDEDKEALLKTVKAKGLEWPEYFDGKGWESDVGTRFGVRSIPAAWLVDKKGLAHAVSEDADLDSEIAKLLADKP